MDDSEPLKLVRRYRVPWRPMPESVKYKARLAYFSRWSAEDRSDAEHVADKDSQWVEFEAATHDEAARLLNRLILPEDRRPVWRRKQVADWVVR
jgi:hypothetical protein